MQTFLAGFGVVVLLFGGMFYFAKQDLAQSGGSVQRPMEAQFPTQNTPASEPTQDISPQPDLSPQTASDPATDTQDTTPAPAQLYLPILMFHHIEDVPADHPDAIYRGLSFSPERFGAFLEYFQANDITPLTFGELQLIAEGKLIAPPKGVLLTFDDGYANNYSHAFRLLQQYGMKGNFNIITDKIGESDFYMNAEQIRLIVQGGHQLCSHTVSHPDLTQISSADLTHELRRSKQILETDFSTTVNCLVYPAGKHNADVVAQAQQDYYFARTTDPGKQASFTDRHTLPTVRIFPDTSVSSLQRWFDDVHYQE